MKTKTNFTKITTISFGLLSTVSLAFAIDGHEFDGLATVVNGFTTNVLQ